MCAYLASLADPFASACLLLDSSPLCIPRELDSLSRALAMSSQKVVERAPQVLAQCVHTLCSLADSLTATYSSPLNSSGAYHLCFRGGVSQWSGLGRIGWDL